MIRPYSVTISSGIRLYTLVVDNVESPDSATLWSQIELDVAIVCACLLPMMPLFKLVRQKAASKAILLRTLFITLSIHVTWDMLYASSVDYVTDRQLAFLHVDVDVERKEEGQ